MLTTRLSQAAGASAAALGLLFTSFAAQAFDVDAAQALAKKNNCFKCHSVDKKKEGPAFKETAAKLKGKSDAVAQMTKHLTTAVKVKLPDGTEEEHKVIKTKDAAEIRNLVDWLLAQ